MANEGQRGPVGTAIPSGYDPKNLRQMVVSATLDAPDAETYAAAVRDAGVSMVSNGRPTVMRVVAWMAHEGMNRNRLEFLKEDLEASVVQLQPPNILPMDFNHSAIQDPEHGGTVIGAWYKGEYAFNPAAKDGAGAYGILLYGVIWSALFQKYSTTLLAEQARNGKIDFSMACIFESVDLLTDATGRWYERGHKPVWFTHSALDMRPADPDASGVGVEGSSGDDPDLEKRLADELKAARAINPGLHAARPVAAFNESEIAVLTACLPRLQSLPRPALTLLAAHASQGEPMDELLKFLKENVASMADKATLDELVTRVTALVEAHAAGRQDAETLATAQAEVTALAAQVAERDTQLAEHGTRLATLTEELTTANATIEAQNAALAERDAELAKYRAEEAERAEAARVATRKAALPEVYLRAHETHDAVKRTEIESAWARMDDPSWEAFVAGLEVLPRSRHSYLDRSQSQGPLPSGGGTHRKTTKDRLAQFKA